MIGEMESSPCQRDGQSLFPFSYAFLGEKHTVISAFIMDTGRRNGCFNNDELGISHRCRYLLTINLLTFKLQIERDLHETRELV
jgi:hypothetical protein